MSGNENYICNVCGESGKTVGYHLNAIICQACRKFYTRQIKDEKFTKLSCVQSSNSCLITVQTRNNCMYCRFQKCVQIDMCIDENKTSKLTYKDIQCNICSNTSSGIHYGVVCCESCKGFFRTYSKLYEKFSCSDGKCQINYLLGFGCKRCRLDKCFSLGMNTSSN